MPAASYRSVLGVAKETTSGTAVIATDFIPWTAMKAMAVPSYIEDKGIRGSMVGTYGYIKGVVHGELDFSGPAFADSIGYLIESLLPNVATTGASAPFTHTFAALNSGNGQPTTSTFTDYDGVTTNAYPGSKLSDLSFKWASDSLVEYSAKAMSFAPWPTRVVVDGVLNTTTTVTSATAAFTQADVGSPISATGIPLLATIASVTNATTILLSAAATATASGVTVTIGMAQPVASFSAVTPYAGWQGLVTIAAGARTTTNVMLDATIDLKRSVSVQGGATGTSTPILVWSGVLDVTGKFTMVYDTTADYLNMLNNTSPTVLLNFTQGTAAALTQIQFNMTNCSYTAAETDRGGDFVKLAVTFAGRANTTDIGASGGYSPIKVTLQNAKPASTYV